MIGEVDQGGLKMPDLFVMKKMQQIFLIKRLFNEECRHPWKYFVLKELEKVGGNTLFKCNFCTKLLPVKFSSFINDCLNTWSEVNDISDNSDQIIWNNKNVLVGGKSVYYKTLSDAGINYISDTFAGYHRVPWTVFHQKGLNLNQKLKWLGLTLSIPDKLKNQDKSEVINDVSISINNNSFILESLPKSALKRNLIERIIEVPRSQAKLENVINIHNLDWRKMYELTYKLAIDCKSRAFHFKLLHNILYTNTQLNKFNPQKFTSALCTLCKNELETLDHLFCDCKFTIALWRDLLFLLGRSLSLKKPPTKLCMVLGDPNENLTVNFIAMQVRMYIYYCNSFRVLLVSLYS